MLYQSTGPAHLYGINYRCWAQTEMHSQVVLGNIAGTATHFIHQGSLASFDCDLRADPVAIGADSDGLKSDPVVAGMRCIHQEAGHCVHIADEYRKLPIIPEIAHSQAARRGNRIDPWSGRRRYVRERSVAVVMIEKAWLPVLAAQVKFVHLRIDMSVGEDEIGPAIIVKVECGNAEGIVSIGLIDVSLGGDILESPVTAILIQNILRARQTPWSAHHRHALPHAGTSLAWAWSSGGIEIHIICHHQVEKPITVIVNKSTAGTPGFTCSGHASLFGNFGEDAMVIMIETILPVIRDVEIFPTIIIVVSDANALTPSRGKKTGLHGAIRESPIMIVVIQVVRGGLI